VLFGAISTRTIMLDYKDLCFGRYPTARLMNARNIAAIRSATEKMLNVSSQKLR
jgi:hypothetical protein